MLQVSFYYFDYWEDEKDKEREGIFVYAAYVYFITAIVNLIAIIVNGFILSTAISFFVSFIPKITVVSLTNNLLSSMNIKYQFIQNLKVESELTLYWSAIIIFAGVSLSFTSVYDVVLRKFYGFGRPIRDERERLNRLFAEVCERAGKSPADYRLYVTDEQCLNACAVGANSIAITRELLMNGNDRTVKAVLAHEIGHIHYNDSAHLKVFVTINVIGQIALWSMKIFASLVGFLGRLPIPFFNLFALLLSGVSWITVFVLDLLLMMPLTFAALFGSRRQEYRADQYACSIGYGNDLYDFIHSLLKSGYTPPKGLSILWRSHPDHRSRLNHIEAFMNRQKDHLSSVGSRTSSI